MRFFWQRTSHQYRGGILTCSKYLPYHGGMNLESPSKIASCPDVIEIAEKTTSKSTANITRVNGPLLYTERVSVCRKPLYFAMRSFFFPQAAFLCSERVSVCREPFYFAEKQFQFTANRFILQRNSFSLPRVVLLCSEKVLVCRKLFYFAASERIFVYNQSFFFAVKRFSLLRPVLL